MNSPHKPPMIDGVSPSRVFLQKGPWLTYEDFLAARIPAVSKAEWKNRLAKGQVLDAECRPIAPGQPCPFSGMLYYYRSLPDERPIPLAETIVYQDKWLVVADKPHFLPVIPTGRYLHETLLVRLKKKLKIDTLSPIHRIDRETAGLVVFCIKPETRACYQALFREKAVEKHYEAIAPYRPDLPLPVCYRSCLAPSEKHFMQMKETAGITNAETRIRLIESKGQLARYALQPLTGKKHQLRVQMAALGIPILYDRIYPCLFPEEQAFAGEEKDFSRPLQLLAKTLSFTDPVTKQFRFFESAQQLRL
ncbi:MAG: pseudouridine synthase [Oxalobacter formigenes]|nr:pseudouridine synthase [Oxalobacter formigenes]